MRITKVVTKGGDKGETSLVGGARVSKASSRVNAYGEVDELNSLLGMVRSEIKDADLDQLLRKIQNDLFTLGSDLASPSEIEVPRMEQRHIAEMETTIDQFLNELEPLKEFILPGGNRSGAIVHLARAISRRAERAAVRLNQEEKINPVALAYLNRLSDFLFILARIINKRSGAREEQTNFRVSTKPARGKS